METELGDKLPFFRTTVLGISFGMAFLILSLILFICFIGHFLVSLFTAIT